MATDGANIASAIAAAFSALAAIVAAYVAFIAYRSQQVERAFLLTQKREQTAVSVEQLFGTSLGKIMLNIRNLARRQPNRSPEEYAYAYYMAKRDQLVPSHQQDHFKPLPPVLAESDQLHCRDAIEACKTFWNNFQALAEAGQLPDDISTRLGGTWAIRAEQCLRLVEPLDVANWYIFGLHAHNGNGAYSKPGSGFRPARYAFLEQLITKNALPLPYGPDAPGTLDEWYKLVYGL